MAKTSNDLLSQALSANKRMLEVKTVLAECEAALAAAREEYLRAAYVAEDAWTALESYAARARKG